ncbi:MAG: phosphoribosylanthranilate isomerase [Desulfuromonas sp.]|uniref:phosphoribosylanthranilate isomerase n=1 Tax=Desulfuromonas sp. TaxID=892 RepID=UPI000CAF786C|nr:phosphoribosylanthranilate isomerase [Desulfuromonas sp.]PLX86093.1 MAG: phosphoribosylanthranilate isomerase [Desulfuromonas sp.]
MTAGCKVKLCGTTSRLDADMAARAGADWFGVVVETDFSPRSLTIEEAGPLFADPPLPAVTLVFEMPESRLMQLAETLRPHAIQFLSQEDPALLLRLKAEFPEIQLWQSLHLPPAGAAVELEPVRKAVRDYLAAGADLLLFDTAAVVGGTKKFGGTGITADWGVIRTVLDEIRGTVPVLLAGGIGPENAAAAIEAVRPDGLDLCSGVEAAPGKRDPAKVRALMEAVRGAGNGRTE